MQGKRKCGKIGPLKGGNGEILMDNAQKADSLSEFFTTIVPRLANNIEPINAQPFEHLFRVTPTISLPCFNDIMFAEKIISRVKPGKSHGPNGITSSELKIAGKFAAVSLKSVMRKSINDGKFPDQWKTSRVRAFYKKGNTLERGNFRSISLLDIPGKILESIIADSVDYHIVNNLGRLCMH